VIVQRVIDDFVGFATYADEGWLNALVDEERAVSSVQLEVDPDLDSRLALYAAVKRLPAVEAINDNAQAKEKLVTTLLDTLRYSIGALIGMAAVIFFGGILTTSLISISERQREIATFLVLGLERRQVGGVFLRESLLVNVTGALVGLPLGLLLVVSLIRTTSQEAFRLPLVASPLSYFITVGLAVLFTVTAHLLVQGVINRLDWREALNAKE
jgi:putative ABC transport system permease protein